MQISRFSGSLLDAIQHTGIGLGSNLDAIGATSGQTLQDANLLKIRITHGYKPKVWLMGMIHSKFLAWTDTGRDSFATQLIANGRIPVVTHVTVEMQSEALETKNSNQGSSTNAGSGGGGSTSDQSAPACATMGCSVTYTPADPGSNGSSSNGNSGSSGSSSGQANCAGANCPVCQG